MVVEGELAQPGLPDSPANGKRSICIDPDDGLVLRYRIERTVAGDSLADPSFRVAETISFSRILRSPKLADALFEFSPLAGSVRISPSERNVVWPRIYPTGR
jgi:hypothetical protein